MDAISFPLDILRMSRWRTKGQLSLTNDQCTMRSPLHPVHKVQKPRVYGFGCIKVSDTPLNLKMAGGAIWWPNSQPIQVAPHDGQI